MRRLYLVKTEGLPYQIRDSWQEFSLSMEKRKVEKEMTGCVSDRLAPLAHSKPNTFHFLPLQALTLPRSFSPHYRHPPHPLLYTSTRHGCTHAHTHTHTHHLPTHCRFSLPSLPTDLSSIHQLLQFEVDTRLAAHPMRGPGRANEDPEEWLPVFAASLCLQQPLGSLGSVYRV